MRTFLLLSLFVFFFGGVLGAVDLDYGIMIDAGSSGSRIYLYEWPHRVDNSLPLVEPAEINQTVISKKNNLPLSGFTSNPSDAGASLQSLIDYVKASFDPSQYSETPIYLKGTAGMRALSQSDQDAIIANVRQFLHTTPFLFEDDQARVIPGTEEGVFGWITTNYAMQELQKLNPTTYGALDMGGASTQITFVPQSPPTSNNITEPLGPNTYQLYTYSYPLGQDEAGRILLAGLLNDNVVDEAGNVLTPCYLLGYNETYQNVLAVGTGNFSGCQDAIRKYIVTTDTSCASTCGIGNVYQPPINGEYYAFSGFAYTNQFFSLSANASIAELRGAGSDFCATIFQNAQTEYPSVDAQYLKIYCFTATYFTEVLSKYGFSDDSRQIHTQVSIGDIELTWALGGMIYEANLLPFSNSSSTTTSTTSSPLVTTTSSSSSPLFSSFSALLLCFLLLTALLM